MKRERLFAGIPAPRASLYGIGVDDILRVPPSPELVADLLDCRRMIRSPGPSAAGMRSLGGAERLTFA